MPGPPTVFDVVLGSLSVLAGSTLAFFCLAEARRGHHLLYLMGSGFALLVIGVVGQRPPQVDGHLATVVPGRPSSSAAIWEASLAFPVVGIRVTPVTAGGLLVAAVGLGLLLVLEPSQRLPPRKLPARPFDDGDAR